MISNILILFSPFAPLKEDLISFLLLIDAKVYGIFAYLYKIYLDLAQVKLFDITAFNTFVNNIYVIFGVIALFFTTFSLLKTLVNPDDLNNSATSIRNLIMRLILAIGLTCVLPFAFDFLYDVQSSIFNWQVIPKVLGIYNDSLEQDEGELTMTDKYACNEETCYCSSDKCIIIGENGEYIEKNHNDIIARKNQTVQLRYGSLRGSELTYTNEYQGYNLAFFILNGFIYPTDESIDPQVSESTVNAFNKSGVVWGLGGCLAIMAAGGAAGAIVGTVVPGPGNVVGAIIGIAKGVIGCGVGALLGKGIQAVGFALTAEDYTWSNFEKTVLATGDFDKLPPFAEAVQNGELNYTFLISTIAGLFLCYMMFSFCLDLGVRAAKLVFYQILAPISFLLSALPKNKDLLGNWFKAVLTTWAEVFIRVFCVCGVSLLVRNIFSFETLSNIGFFPRAIIILGLVAFAKQVPKLIEDITGIKSGNMKLGIKEKLAAGGAFTAGAIIGGGITSGVRNLTNTGRNIKNNWNNDKDKGVKTGKRIAHAFKGAGSGLFSTAAGLGSGAFRGGKAGWSAKSGKDMKSAASTGAKGAVEARAKRANYKAAHGNSAINSFTGHIKDIGRSTRDFALDQNIEGLTRESSSMGQIVSSFSNFSDGIESILEKEQAKGAGSVFLGNGFSLTNYSAFDSAAQQVATDRARFNAGMITASQLQISEQNYTKAKDAVKDELMNLTLKGSNGAEYKALSDKGKATLKDSMVNAQTLQATVMSNASSKVVQEIMGANGNKALEKIAQKKPLSTVDFEHNGVKLKDAAKVAQGKADIKIAEMNKENAAKGDKK